MLKQMETLKCGSQCGLKKGCRRDMKRRETICNAFKQKKLKNKNCPLWIRTTINWSRASRATIALEGNYILCY